MQIRIIVEDRHNTMPQLAQEGNQAIVILAVAEFFLRIENF